MRIYGEDEFQDLVGKLNTLYPEFEEWRFTQARKAHTDEFGDEIQDRDVYFKRKYGPAYDEVLKLSKGSMDTMLFCIFGGNFGLVNVCDNLVEGNKKRFREKYLKYHPLKLIESGR